MFRVGKFLLLAAVLVGAAILGAPTQAHADLKIYLQQDGILGSAITEKDTAVDFTSAFFSGTYGDFTVTIFGGSSDNGATLSDLLAATVSVTNNNAAARTLRLYVSQINYSLPVGSPLAMESGLGGSVTTGTVGLTDIFEAFADSGNTYLGSTFSNTAQDATQIGSTFATGSEFGSFTRSGDYSLTSKTTFAMSGGGKGNFSNHVNVTQVVPAPAGVVLALTGLPFLGIGTWLRRRKVKMQNN